MLTEIKTDYVRSGRKRPSSLTVKQIKDCNHFSPEPPTEIGVIGKCMLVGRAVFRDRTCDHVEPIGEKTQCN